MINLKEKIIYIGIVILIVIISFNYSQMLIGLKSYNLCIEKFTTKELSVPKRIYIFDDNSSLATVNIESINDSAIIRERSTGKVYFKKGAFEIVEI